MTENTLSLAGRASKNAWATPDDWERFRDTIKQLYLDQNKSLKEAMVIMDCDHDFHATVKMYKSRITQWGFDKKNRASDMEFVLRKKMHRDAVHKNTSFTVRGRSLDMKAFSNYIKRHNLLERITIEANTDTPEHISYQTPAASPHPQAETNELNTASDKDDERLEEVSDNARLSDCSLGRISIPSDGRSTQDAPTALSVSELQDLYHWLFDQPSLTRKLALPESMRLSERLFLLIPTHIAGAIRKGVWALDTDGRLASTTVTNEMYSSPGVRFDDIVIVAFEALHQHHFVEARQALDKAFALMPFMIRYDLPITMESYLTTVWNMTRAGFPELADVLRRHMKDVAALVLPRHNPASQIYAVMSEVDPNQLSNVLEKALERRTDSFARNLAPFNFDFINSKIDSINRIHRNSPTEVENRLRILHFECEQHCGHDSQRTLNVMAGIIINLVILGRSVEAETMSHDMHDRVRHSESFGWKITAPELLDKVQQAPGRLPALYSSLSAVIDVLERRYGRNDGLCTRFVRRLEKLP